MFTEPQGKPAPPQQEPPDTTERLRKILRYTPILILILAIYVGFVLYSRWSDDRYLAAKTREHAAEQRREEDQRSLDNMGGNEFKILGFYATPGWVHRGDNVDLCYGVANAQTVKIEPDIHQALWPSVSRCVPITPKKTTTYTLTADDGHGNTKTVSFTLEIH